MRKKILIYGYGWVGESAYDFFRYFGFDCKIIDDLLDFSEISFFNSDFRMDVDILEFDFYIVAICNKKTAISLKEKLISIGVDANQIKNFSNDKYNKNMEYLLDEYFIDSIDTFLNDEFSLDRLHNSLKNVVCKHYENKKSNNLKHRRLEFDKKSDKGVFSSILHTGYKSSSGKPIIYPGFYSYCSHYKESDKDFYFIDKLDFDSIRNRDPNVKFIACFGNSALRVEYLPTSDSITANMQSILDKEFTTKYIVANFGIGSQGVYDQLLTFNALCFTLKPDIVLSFFGGTDYRNGVYCCDRLVKQHKIVYTPESWEVSYKSATNSSLPLFREMSKIKDGSNPKITMYDVLDSVKVRLAQFNSYVAAGGGLFMLLYSHLVYVN